MNARSKVGGVLETSGVFDFGILGGWNIGDKSTKGIDPPIHVSLYNASPCASRDPFRSLRLRESEGFEGSVEDRLEG
jgi:hypothetical protein